MGTSPSFSIFPYFEEQEYKETACPRKYGQAAGNNCRFKIR